MIEKERARLIYQTMNRIRCFELKAVSLFEANKLRGSVHLYVGEEAVAATVCSRLTDQDYIASTHRGHGHWYRQGRYPRSGHGRTYGKIYRLLQRTQRFHAHRRPLQR